MSEIFSEIAFPLLVTSIAGLSTVFGALIVFFTKANNDKFLSLALGFSAGVMIYVSFMEIMPTSVQYLSETSSGRSPELIMLGGFLGGIFLIGIIDKLVPDEDNPHHSQFIDQADLKDEEDIEEAILESKKSNGSGKNLERVGIMTAFGIAIHNFPEGLATFMAALVSPELGISIAIAIALHNIPEGIAVAVPIYNSSGSKSKAFWITFLSGFAEPLGGIVGYFLLRPFINNTTFGIIYALVAGIMVYISLDELLPASREYGEEHLSIYGVVGGMIVMAFSLIMIG